MVSVEGPLMFRLQRAVGMDAFWVSVVYSLAPVKYERPFPSLLLFLVTLVQTLPPPSRKL